MLAWAVIPQDIKWSLLDGRVVINSWRLFLLISTLFPLIAGVGSAFCHESPRFLMAKGRKDKALRVFQSIYSVNTGNPEHTYSVTQICQTVKYYTWNTNNVQSIILWRGNLFANQQILTSNALSLNFARINFRYASVLWCYRGILTTKTMHYLNKIGFQTVV